jgi:hypothetical protein
VPAPATAAARDRDHAAAARFRRRRRLPAAAAAHATGPAAEDGEAAQAETAGLSAEAQDRNAATRRDPTNSVAKAAGVDRGTRSLAR